MAKILISYVYFENEISKYNLEFFARVGIYKSENVDFVIVINGHTCNVNIPNFKNVKIIKRENIGFDFGGHASVLADCLDYDYYIFLNCSVIGPFLPTYFTDEWPSIFTKRINKSIKLVGTTIVCLPENDDGGFGPKVEGFCFATDKIGLQILKDTKTIFVQHSDKHSTIVNGEYGISNAILKAGYNLDCLLYKYQGMDWTDTKNWRSNDNKHPSRYKTYDGINIHPFEVVFHKWCWLNQGSIYNQICSNYIHKYTEWKYQNQRYKLSAFILVVSSENAKKYISANITFLPYPIPETITKYIYFIKDDFFKSDYTQLLDLLFLKLCSGIFATTDHNLISMDMGTYCQFYQHVKSGNEVTAIEFAKTFEITIKDIV